MKIGQLSTQQLMDIPLGELPVFYRGSWVHSLARMVQAELEEVGLPMPKVWVSDDWFCPDGHFGVAIPFFLLHPRLIELEREQMGEAEGSSEEWCLKILRHEAGHALDNAFALRSMPGRAELFGISETPYPKYYIPNTKSRAFVEHLHPHYAQAHPDEDWAETFAVWLDPYSQWPRRYRSYPTVVKKLLFMDYAMEKIAGSKPLIRTLSPVGSLSTLTLNLREYYRRKKAYRTRHQRVDQAVVL